MAIAHRTATCGWVAPPPRPRRGRPRGVRVCAAAAPDPAATSAARSPSPSSSPPLRPEDISVEVAPSVESVGRDAWDGLATKALSPGDGGDNPFVFYAFLHAAEASGSAAPAAGWLPQHLVARDPAGRIVGLAPAYMKAHSAGEYVFDSAWASAYGRAGGRYYPKILGAVPFSPVTGPRLLVDEAGDPAAAASARTALARAFAALTDDLGLSSAHINFLDEPSAAAFKGCGAGFVERLGIQFHWRNEGYTSFADFEAALKQSRRKAVRQERKKVAAAGLAIDRLPGGAALSPKLVDRFYTFYADTALRRWGEPYFQREFFHRLFDAEAGLPPDRVMLVLAAEGGQHRRGAVGEDATAVVAGALNLVGSHALFGRHWGAAPGSDPVPGLHFELSYYSAIEEAIARGLPRVEAGAQGQDTKLPRGYLPCVTRSAHFLRDPGLRGAVADFCAREAREVDYAVSVLGVRDNPYKQQQQ